MTSSKIAAVVLGAGKGTRMKSDLPKVLMPICGKPMIRNILDTLDGMDADKIVVVTAPDGELVRKEVAPHRSVIQQQQLGTGDAVMAAAPVLEGFDGDVLTIFGDHPIITKETFLKAVDKRREGYAVVVLGSVRKMPPVTDGWSSITASWRKLSSLKTQATRKRRSRFAIPALCALTAA